MWRCLTWLVVKRFFNDCKKKGGWREMEQRHGWESRRTQPRPSEMWSLQSCLSRAGRLGSFWILLFAQLAYFLSEVKKFPEQGRQVRLSLLNCSHFLFLSEQSRQIGILLLFAPGKLVVSELFVYTFLNFYFLSEVKKFPEQVRQVGIFLFFVLCFSSYLRFVSFLCEIEMENRSHDDVGIAFCSKRKLNKNK